MPKEKTRRSISVNGITYQRLKNYCRENRRSVSGFLDEVMNAKLDEEGAPVPECVEPRSTRGTTKVDSQLMEF